LRHDDGRNFDPLLGEPLECRGRRNSRIRGALFSLCLQFSSRTLPQTADYFHLGAFAIGPGTDRVVEKLQMPHAAVKKVPGLSKPQVFAVA
jgi:hypothetical protein